MCKSAGDENVYYLRVKAHWSSLVTTLEDSNRYAGEDRVFISGEWEFGESETSRMIRIPHRLGTSPSRDRDLSVFFSHVSIPAGLISLFVA